MKNFLLLLGGLFPLIASAGHAKDDWPEPVSEHYTGRVLFDRLEIARTNQHEQSAVWDMMAWYGGDYHRLVFKTEGENVQNDGAPTDIEKAELLYGYLVSPFWSIQAGVGARGELSSDSSFEHYAVLSFSGLAPYWFEMDNSLMVNEEGDIQLRSETEYEWRLSQTAYLQPRVEITANVTDSEKYRRESGLSNLRVGLRYRQEISREFAPYIGVYWNQALGNTADRLQREERQTHETGIVVGARVWF